VSGGIGREGEVMLLGCGAKAIEDDSRLDARDAARGIDFKNARHVLRKVENDGGVAALSGKRSPAAAGQQWSAVFAAEGNRGENIFFIARNYDADWDLAVV
jgi:hypothetical protein